MTAPDFSTRRNPRVLQPVEVALLAATGLVLLAASYAASDAWAERGRARQAEAQERREVDLLAARAEHKGRRAEAWEAPLLLSIQAPPQRVLAELAELLPPDVRLEAATLSYAARLHVEARVAARRVESYDLFLRRLGESARFEGIVPGAEARQGPVQASLQMTYRAEAAK
jgi:hypothetical protein